MFYFYTSQRQALFAHSLKTICVFHWRLEPHVLILNWTSNLGEVYRYQETNKIPGKKAGLPFKKTGWKCTILKAFQPNYRIQVIIPGYYANWQTSASDDPLELGLSLVSKRKQFLPDVGMLSQQHEQDTLPLLLFPHIIQFHGFLESWPEKHKVGHEITDINSQGDLFQMN